MGKFWNEVILGLDPEVKKEGQMEQADWIPRSRLQRDTAAQGIVNVLNDADKHIKHADVLREIRMLLTQMISMIDSAEDKRSEEAQ